MCCFDPAVANRQFNSVPAQVGIVTGTGQAIGGDELGIGQGPSPASVDVVEALLIVSRFCAPGFELVQQCVTIAGDKFDSGGARTLRPALQGDSHRPDDNRRRAQISKNLETPDDLLCLLSRRKPSHAALGVKRELITDQRIETPIGLSEADDQV